MNHEGKSRITFNRHLLYAMLLAGFMAWIAKVMLADGETGVGIGCAVFALFFFAVPVLMMPVYYRFDTKGVTFCYLFLQNERYLWKKIRTITIERDSRGPTVFQLTGKPEGTPRFYMDGKIPKTHRTKRLLETCWDGTITGYFFENFQKRRRKRKKIQERQTRQHLADEVIPMERQVRAEAREALRLLCDQAAQLDLTLRIKFCYTTEDLEEQNSRPEEDYVYTVLVEICRPGETDNSRIITDSAGLLHVRLGKTAFRGVKDEGGLEDLKQSIGQILDDIRKSGLDAYCRRERMDDP